MSQEPIGNEIEKKILKEKVNEQQVKKMFKMQLDAFQKFTETVQGTFDEIKAAYESHLANKNDMLQYCRDLRNDNSFVVSVRDVSCALMQELNTLFENIKTINQEINEIISQVRDECNAMDAKIILLQECLSVRQNEVTEVENGEIRVQMQASKEKLHAGKVKVALKEDSLAATKRAASAKEEKYENIHQDRINSQQALNNICVEDIDRNVSQLTANKESKEKDITAVNIDIQNAKEMMENTEGLHQELTGNVEKLSVLIKKEEESNVEKFNSLSEKQNSFQSLLKARCDLEAKNVFDANMATTHILRDELNKSEEMKKQLADAQRQCEELKAKAFEATSTLNERKLNITNIDRKMMALKDEKAARCVSPEEIQVLNEQIKNADDAIAAVDSRVADIKDELKKKGGIPIEDLLNIKTNVEDDSFTSIRSGSSESSYSADILSIISSLSATFDTNSGLLKPTANSASSKSAKTSLSSSRAGKKKRRTK